MNENKKADKSLVHKLNIWHFSRVLSSFIWIDIVIICLVAAALFYSAESRASNYWLENSTKPPVAGELTDYDPSGIRLPAFFAKNFKAEHMTGSVREIVNNAEKHDNRRLQDKIDGLTYRVWIRSPEQDYYYAYDYQIGKDILTALFIARIVLLLQFIYLIFVIAGGARAIRFYLKPIADLTRTTRKINYAADNKAVIPTNTESDGSLSTLTGKIESISISDLDQRIAIDSTQRELKELAEAINSMLDRINEAYRSQVRFVSDASHELRTPISVIQGYANLLDRWGKNDTKVLEESISAIRSETQNMRDLIEQLLFLARSDNRTLQLVVEHFSLSELAEELVRETELIDTAHIFERRIEPEVYTRGDKQLIKQMLRIFVDNSIKYTPAGQAIQIRVGMDEKAARIVIQDNGIGIPPDDVPHVFDRFFRSDDSRTRKSGGAGLGLSIAKWIIDRHGGSVNLISRQDIGTRITVELPVSAHAVNPI